MAGDVEDAGTIARREFRVNLRKPWVQMVALGLLAVGGALIFVLSPLVGLIAMAALPALFIFLVPYSQAWSVAGKSFYAGYAKSRDLTAPADSGSFDIGFTPLLHRGDSNWWNHVMQGDLPGGINGTLGTFTFQTHHTDNDGNRQTTNYEFTAAVTQIPDTAAIPNIYCHPHTPGFGIVQNERNIIRWEDVRELKLESVALEKVFDIHIPSEADETLVKQVFDPVFVDWLAGLERESFAFEFSEGVLCGYIYKAADEAEKLDALCETTAKVAKRFRDEAAEAR